MDSTQSVRAVLMRGGTSRGLVVTAEELPPDPAARARLVAALYGAGSEGQIDGVGGGVAHTSKVAVVSASSDPDADVDYLFGQVATDRPDVDFSGTCGNMASAVALFAVQEGFTVTRRDPAKVTIRDVSSGQLLRCEVLDAPADAYASGGLPPTGSPVLLDLSGMAGASTGQLLPTGQVRQELALPDGRCVPASVVDIGNVLAFVPAESLGLTGYERPEEIEGTSTMATLAHLRGSVAVALGWCETPEEWASAASRLPFIALVGRAEDGSGADVALRLYAVGRIHRAIAVTAVAATGAAAAMPGSVVNEVLARPFDAETALSTDVPVYVAHPGGVATTGVRVAPPSPEAPTTMPAALRYARTARRLMEGNAYLPSNIAATQTSLAHS
jgi:2-methylaconitate cis-trans-isomerase PrpF